MTGQPSQLCSPCFLRFHESAHFVSHFCSLPNPTPPHFPFPWNTAFGSLVTTHTPKEKGGGSLMPVLPHTFTSRRSICICTPYYYPQWSAQGWLNIPGAFNFSGRSLNLLFLAPSHSRELEFWQSLAGGHPQPLRETLKTKDLKCLSRFLVSLQLLFCSGLS